MVFGFVCGDILRGAPDHCCELDFPIDSGATVGQNNRVAVADDGALGRFQEKIRHAAVFSASAPGFGAFFRRPLFVHVAVKIHGGVKDFPWIDNRRQRPKRINIVYIVRSIAARELCVQDQVVDDLVEAGLQTILIPADQFLHVGGHREHRIHPVRLQRRVRFIEIDDQAVAQDDPDARCSLDFKRSKFEDLRYILGPLGPERVGNEKSYKQSES